MSTTRVCMFLVHPSNGFHLLRAFCMLCEYHLAIVVRDSRPLDEAARPLPIQVEEFTWPFSAKPLQIVSNCYDCWCLKICNMENILYSVIIIIMVKPFFFFRMHRTLMLVLDITNIAYNPISCDFCIFIFLLKCSYFIFLATIRNQKSDDEKIESRMYNNNMTMMMKNTHELKYNII